MSFSSPSEQPVRRERTLELAVFLFPFLYIAWSLWLLAMGIALIV